MTPASGEMAATSIPRQNAESMSEQVTYRLLSGQGTRGGALLVAQAAYHLDELLPTRAALARRGIDAIIVCPVPPASIVRRWRSSWWRHRELVAAAASAGLTGTQTMPADGLLVGVTVVVVRNDWGVPRGLVKAAIGMGVPTVGWVEGVQDYADADTGRARRPYREVDHVLTLGDYDRGQLLGTDATIVGSERLWRAWHGPVSAVDGPIVANVNFTYGVLESERGRWVRDVMAVARTCDQRIVLSRHPADRGRLGRRAEDRSPIEQLLAHAPRLISRFSTLCYEALARGVELTYHNPHGEQVATFADRAGAFEITRSRAELLDAVSRPPPSPIEVRRRAEQFLRHHLALDGPAPAERAAAVIAGLV
jgi:hypothetical protein